MQNIKERKIYEQPNEDIKRKRKSTTAFVNEDEARDYENEQKSEQNSS